MTSRQAQEPAVEPSTVDLYNQAVALSIEQTLRRGLLAPMQPAGFYVVRGRATGVMSVIGSATPPQDPPAEFGPDTFAACLQFVNASVAIRLARNDRAPSTEGDAP